MRCRKELEAPSGPCVWNALEAAREVSARPSVLATPRAAPECPQGPGDVGAETQEPLANQGAPSVANTDAGDECQETCLTPRSLDGRLLLQRTEPRALESPALSHAMLS